MNPLLETPTGPLQMDNTLIPGIRTVLRMLGEIVMKLLILISSKKRPNSPMNSDNWHVFYRADFSGNRQCLESKNAGLGANKITVLFILKFGHNPGLKYCGGTPESNGSWSLTSTWRHGT